MKPSNWISGMGRMPAMARPMAVPMMPDSARGVSTTRSAPKRAWRPSVTRKTPPFLPMSSPRRMTRSSAASSWARARLMAWTRVSWGMGCWDFGVWIAECGMGGAEWGGSAGFSSVGQGNGTRPGAGVRGHVLDDCADAFEHRADRRELPFGHRDHDDQPLTFSAASLRQTEQVGCGVAGPAEEFHQV